MMRFIVRKAYRGRLQDPDEQVVVISDRAYACRETVAYCKAKRISVGPVLRGCTQLDPVTLSKTFGVDASLTSSTPSTS